ncbi:hypothetical protein [Phytohabitans houttuyneae]|nr:hypothetical protein [Phytohabitans houttuyneae]
MPPAEAGPSWSPARLAYWFYAVAATGAVIGQTWVAVTHAPWPPGVPAIARVAAVLPFALCLELLAMTLSAMADQRMRLGERAYGFRTFSTVVAMVAVGILVAGHWPHLYWSAGFGVLSGSAYALWLLHSAARRRDALRAAGKLADTAPDYGLWRRMRHPVWTARAAELAREGRVDVDSGRWRPLGLFESLRAAELAIRAEQRRPAIANAVEEVIRADQRDPGMAEIAVRTLDLDRLAGELAALVNYGAWADRLAPAITAPAPASTGPPSGQSAPGEPTELTPITGGDASPAASPEPENASDHDGRRVADPETVADRDDVLSAEPDRNDVDANNDETDPDDEYDDVGHEPDQGAELDADLVPLLPAARAARDELAREGHTVSRDALAHRLRRNGHSIRNNRVSELLAALRQETRSANGSRPTTPV